jgi:hypothetical protein
MRALVVFESMFGNTSTIAQAVAAGLSSRLDVELVEVSSAPTVLGEDVALLVAGGPTHALGLSRPGTRADAVRQGAAVRSTRIGLREWLAGLARGHGIAATTFDTRVDKPRVPGSAARAAARRLRAAGFSIVAPATSFYVDGTQGPLVEGEVARAQRWATAVGEKVVSARVTQR